MFADAHPECRYCSRRVCNGAGRLIQRVRRESRHQASSINISRLVEIHRRVRQRTEIDLPESSVGQSHPRQRRAPVPAVVALVVIAPRATAVADTADPIITAVVHDHAATVTGRDSRQPRGLIGRVAVLVCHPVAETVFDARCQKCVFCRLKAIERPNKWAAIPDGLSNFRKTLFRHPIEVVLRTVGGYCHEAFTAAVLDRRKATQPSKVLGDVTIGLAVIGWRDRT